MKMRSTVVFPLLVGAWLALQTFASAAQSATQSTAEVSPGSVKIETVQIGFDGRYKLGFWTPVRITLASADTVTGRLEVTVPDSDGVPTTVTTDATDSLRIPAGERITETLYIKPGQLGGAMRIRLFSGQQRLAEQVLFPDAAGGPASFPPGLPATTRLLVVFGGEIDLAGALRTGFEDPAVATHVVSVPHAEGLPEQAIGWDGVDDAVLLTSDPTPYFDGQFTARRAALSNWVESGGRLHVFIGRSGDDLLSVGQPLASFVPGDYAGEVPLRQPGVIEELSDSRYSLEVPPGAFTIRVPHVEQVDGHSIEYGANLPLIVRSIRGFGELVWVGLDINLPPLLEWQGRPDLLRRLIGTRDEMESNVASDVGKLTSLGFTDLVGQLRAALDVFPGIRTFSFAWVIGLTLLYLVLLGPLDYLLVHRWGRRPVLTWLTLPVFVLLVGGGAYGLAEASKGDRLRVNQVELVDVDLESELVRGNLWAHLYTPRHDRFTLALQPPSMPSGLLQGSQAIETERVLSWLGLPGRGLGGLEAAADGYGVERGYRYTGERGQLEGLPLAIWSSKSLHGQWSARFRPPVDAELTAGDRDPLAGTVSSGLDQTLTNAMLYYQRWVYRLGTIEPGQTIEVMDRPFVSSTNQLTRQTAYGKATPPYDPAVGDARRVLQMMSWYELAGGARYTGLLNRYQSRLDFEYLLDAGRAVLVAESTAPASQLLLDEEPLQDPDGQHIVVYRVVIPVQPADN